jgi:hypothetical protein
VIRRPLDALVKEHRLAWVLFDLTYTEPDHVGLGAVLSLAVRRGQFALYRVSDGDAALS